MKLKIALAAALFAAGLGASIAVAHTNQQKDNGGEGECNHVSLQGTVGPQTFTLTVTHSHGTPPVGSTVVVTIGSTGQTVRAKAKECVTGTGTSQTTTVRSVDLRAFTPETSTSSTSTGKHEGDDDQGEHHGTTTTSTTATTTTTHG